MSYKLAVRQCAYCGKDFTPTAGNQHCCCEEHAKLYKNFYKRVQMYYRRCPCGKSFIALRRNQYYCCDKHSMKYSRSEESKPLIIRGAEGEQ